MATSTARTNTQLEPVSIAKGWQWTGIAAVGSAILNAILFYIADATGWIPRDFIIPSAGQPITIGVVVFVTILGVVLGGVVFTGLARFTSRPISIFRIVGIVALVLSFASPATVPNAPLGFILTLEVMHIIPGVITIYALTTFTRR